MKKLHGFIKALPIKIACTCFFSAWAFSNGYSQDLPKIIKPAPETAALFRFADYPMDYSTGLPQISIPIYEVQSGSLSVPISISYHASGRRVSDQDGPVALGWSLNAGGMVSRTIYGSPDFGTGAHGTYNFPYPFKADNINIYNLSSPTIQSDLLYLQKLAHYDNPSSSVMPWTDSEYDVFSYSFNNNSGKFIFKDNNGVKTAAMLPYKAYIVKPTYSQWGLTNIDITDDKGVLYKFAAAENYSAATDQAVSGLVLTQIISADKTDVITFKYSTFVQSRYAVSQQSLLKDMYYVFCWAVTHCDLGPPPDPGTVTNDTESLSIENYQISRLTEIDFNQGKVLFNLVNGDDKVDNIQVLNLNNEVIKTIQFNRSVGDYMSDGVRPTNKLDGLVFKDKTGTGIENYTFQYYPTQLPNGVTNVNLRSSDWWGYYNSSGVQSMVPYYTNIEYRNSGGASLGPIAVGDPSTNRNPNLAGLESGVLKKITYPTGGNTQFTYENNMYISNTDGQIKTGPGLRVSQVITDDNRGTISTKTYKYGTGESGYGDLDLEPGPNTMASESYFDYYGDDASFHNPDQWQLGYRQRIFYSGFIPELSALADRPVIYTEVTEYHGTQFNNIGKTVYNYDNSKWLAAPMPNFTSLTIPKMHIYTGNYWDNPALIGQTDYKSVATPQGLVYQKRKQLTNNYNNINIEDVAGFHVARVHVMPQTGVANSLNIEGFAMTNVSMNYFRGPIPIYTYNDYHIPVGIKNLTSTVETLYNNDGSTVSNTTSYVYNASQFLSQTNRTGSDNNSLSTQIKYPADYTGNAVLTQMVGPTLNMLNYPVEQNEFKNGLPVKGVRTNYYNWGSTTPMIAPQTVDVKTSANAYETRLRYYGYDGNGNPLSVSKENGALVSYIWDYQNTYPIAEVKNADTTGIAYTSFEANGTGHWAGINTANIATTTNSITGTKYYNFSGTTLSKAGLSSSTVYVVSYWSKNGAYTVSGTPVSGWPKSIRTVNINGASWTNWEHRVSGASTITVSGTGAIDELRLYPANAQMTSYTFAPLIGMTSQNSAANGINYFEYDAHGRLKLVRDINNNIVKTFNYKYQSATP
jgi:hypothetical protein